VTVANHLGECLSHRHVLARIPDRKGDLVARARLVSKHALDAIG
jgi:hypothetical protein